MKKILCIHPGIAYLPEVEAYKKYFLKYDIEFIDSYKELDNIYDENDFDLLWYMMGTDFKKIDKPKVHDYASLSTGKYIFFKDKIKKYINQKPDLRLFLNKNIKNTYNFNDDVPCLIRDMGIDEIFFQKYKVEKKYDFVYLGAITTERKIPQLLEKFKLDLKDQTILIIGAVPDDIYDDYKNINNITFIGKIAYPEVPQVLLQARYAINMVPNIYPFNIQTSTKLLEYCALGLNVITIEYVWVNKFEKTRNANFFKIDESLNNFNIKNIESYNFKQPSLTDLEWNKMFDNINLIDKVKRII